jgi:uracil-DNA glycosylase
VNEFQFGYPRECSTCHNLNGNLRLTVKPYYRLGNDFRLMLIGQDPTVRERQDRVEYSLMLNDPNSQLSRWLSDVIGRSTVDSVTMYGTNTLKCTFPRVPSDLGGFRYLNPYFKKCKEHLIKEISEFKPDLVLTLGEPAHKCFIQLLDNNTKIEDTMKEAFTGSLTKVAINNIEFDYSPCLHIQGFRVAETYGNRIIVFKNALNSYLIRHAKKDLI